MNEFNIDEIIKEINRIGLYIKKARDAHDT